MVLLSELPKDIFNLDPLANAMLITTFRYPSEIKLNKVVKCYLKGHKPKIENFVGHSSEGGHYRCLCGLWEYVLEDSEKD